MVGERGFERPMNRPFARDEPARASGNAVSVDCRPRGGANFGMAIEAEIIVGGEIDHASAVDDGRRAGVAFVNQEVGILQTHR